MRGDDPSPPTHSAPSPTAYQSSGASHESETRQKKRKRKKTKTTKRKEMVVKEGGGQEKGRAKSKSQQRSKKRKTTEKLPLSQKRSVTSAGCKDSRARKVVDHIGVVVVGGGSTPSGKSHSNQKSKSAKRKTKSTKKEVEKNSELKKSVKKKRRHAVGSEAEEESTTNGRYLPLHLRASPEDHEMGEVDSTDDTGSRSRGIASPSSPQRFPPPQRQLSDRGASMSLVSESVSQSLRTVGSPTVVITGATPTQPIEDVEELALEEMSRESKRDGGHGRHQPLASQKPSRMAGRRRSTRSDSNSSSSSNECLGRRQAPGAGTGMSSSPSPTRRQQPPRAPLPAPPKGPSYSSPPITSPEEPDLDTRATPKGLASSTRKEEEEGGGGGGQPSRRVDPADDAPATAGTTLAQEKEDSTTRRHRHRRRRQHRHAQGEPSAGSAQQVLLSPRSAKAASTGVIDMPAHLPEHYGGVELDSTLNRRNALLRSLRQGPGATSGAGLSGLGGGSQEPSRRQLGESDVGLLRLIHTSSNNTNGIGSTPSSASGYASSIMSSRVVTASSVGVDFSSMGSAGLRCPDDFVLPHPTNVLVFQPTPSTPRTDRDKDGVEEEGEGRGRSGSRTDDMSSASPSLQSSHPADYADLPYTESGFKAGSSSPRNSRSSSSSNNSESVEDDVVPPPHPPLTTAPPTPLMDVLQQGPAKQTTLPARRSTSIFPLAKPPLGRRMGAQPSSAPSSRAIASERILPPTTDHTDTAGVDPSRQHQHQYPLQLPALHRIRTPLSDGLRRRSGGGSGGGGGALPTPLDPVNAFLQDILLLDQGARASPSGTSVSGLPSVATGSSSSSASPVAPAAGCLPLPPLLGTETPEETPTRPVHTARDAVLYPNATNKNQNSENTDHDDEIRFEEREREAPRVWDDGDGAGGADTAAATRRHYPIGQPFISTGMRDLLADTTSSPVNHTGDEDEDEAALLRRRRPTGSAIPPTPEMIEMTWSPDQDEREGRSGVPMDMMMGDPREDPVGLSSVPNVDAAGAVTRHHDDGQRRRVARVGGDPPAQQQSQEDAALANGDALPTDAVAPRQWEREEEKKEETAGTKNEDAGADDGDDGVAVLTLKRHYTPLTSARAHYVQIEKGDDNPTDQAPQKEKTERKRRRGRKKKEENETHNSENSAGDGTNHHPSVVQGLPPLAPEEEKDTQRPRSGPPESNVDNAKPLPVEDEPGSEELKSLSRTAAAAGSPPAGDACQPEPEQENAVTHEPVEHDDDDDYQDNKNKNNQHHEEPVVEEEAETDESNTLLSMPAAPSCTDEPQWNLEEVDRRQEGERSIRPLPENASGQQQQQQQQQSGWSDPSSAAPYDSQDIILRLDPQEEGGEQREGVPDEKDPVEEKVEEERHDGNSARRSSSPSSSSSSSSSSSPCFHCPSDLSGAPTEMVLSPLGTEHHHASGTSSLTSLRAPSGGFHDGTTEASDGPNSSRPTDIPIVAADTMPDNITDNMNRVDEQKNPEDDNNDEEKDDDLKRHSSHNEKDHNDHPAPHIIINSGSIHSTNFSADHPGDENDHPHSQDGRPAVSAYLPSKPEEEKMTRSSSFSSSSSNVSNPALVDPQQCDNDDEGRRLPEEIVSQSSAPPHTADEKKDKSMDQKAAAPDNDNDNTPERGPALPDPDGTTESPCPVDGSCEVGTRSQLMPTPQEPEEMVPPPPPPAVYDLPLKYPQDEDEEKQQQDEEEDPKEEEDEDPVAPEEEKWVRLVSGDRLIFVRESEVGNATARRVSARRPRSTDSGRISVALLSSSCCSTCDARERIEEEEEFGEGGEPEHLEGQNTASGSSSSSSSSSSSPSSTIPSGSGNHKVPEKSHTQAECSAASPDFSASNSLLPLLPAAQSPPPVSPSPPPSSSLPHLTATTPLPQENTLPHTHTPINSLSTAPPTNIAAVSLLEPPASKPVPAKTRRHPHRRHAHRPAPRLPLSVSPPRRATRVIDDDDDDEGKRNENQQAAAGSARRRERSVEVPMVETAIQTEPTRSLVAAELAALAESNASAPRSTRRNHSGDNQQVPAELLDPAQTTSPKKKPIPLMLSARHHRRHHHYPNHPDAEARGSQRQDPWRSSGHTSDSVLAAHSAVNSITSHPNLSGSAMLGRRDAGAVSASTTTGAESATAREVLLGPPRVEVETTPRDLLGGGGAGVRVEVLQASSRSASWRNSGNVSTSIKAALDALQCQPAERGSVDAPHSSTSPLKTSSDTTALVSPQAGGTNNMADDTRRVESSRDHADSGSRMPSTRPPLRPLPSTTRARGAEEAGVEAVPTKAYHMVPIKEGSRCASRIGKELLRERPLSQDGTALLLKAPVWVADPDQDEEDDDEEEDEDDEEEETEGPAAAVHRFEQGTALQGRMLNRLVFSMGGADESHERNNSVFSSP